MFPNFEEPYEVPEDTDPFPDLVVIDPETGDWVEIPQDEGEDE